MTQCNLLMVIHENSLLFILCSVTGIYDKTHKELFKVHINYDGTVFWIYGGIFATRCELDLTYFPYDKQICKLVIENWAYTQKQVYIRRQNAYAKQECIPVGCVPTAD